MSAPLKPRAAAKTHPDDQRCNNCAWSRVRPLGGRMTSTDLECRWGGPPWVDSGVLPGDWCRRWSARPAPKPIAKELVNE